MNTVNSPVESGTVKTAEMVVVGSRMYDACRSGG